jgi:hypothetical protein
MWRPVATTQKREDKRAAIVVGAVDVLRSRPFALVISRLMSKTLRLV